MRRDLLDILVCPECKGALKLDAVTEEAGEVVAGTLTCLQCGEGYPIQERIPNLLPRAMREASGED